MNDKLKHLPDLIEKEYSNIMGLLISKDNQLVYEGYYNGFIDEDSIHIASVTKSIVSLLVGIAIDRGLITSVEDHVLDYFPDYILKRGEKNIRDVKIKHLLTMTAPYKYKSEPYTKVYSSADWTKAALDLLGGRKATFDFKYSTVGMQILSGILVNVSGQSLRDFAEENLFKPLDIEVPISKCLDSKEEHLAYLRADKSKAWISDPKGIQTGGWGLSLKTSDLLKVGQLCLSKGMYQDKRVVSEKWLDESIKRHSRLEDHPYGYLWWLLDDAYAAVGDGGNIIYVNPSKNLVVSITSSFKPRAKDRIHLIKENILPYL